MAKLTMGEIIGKSFNRTILILFKPFSWKKWLLLLFIAFLAGAIGSGSGGGGSSRSRAKKAEAAEQQSVQVGDTASAEQALKQESLIKAEKKTNLIAGFVDLILEKFHFKSRTIVYLLLGAGAFILLAFFVLLTWIVARFKFVWLNAILKNEASIARPFLEYKNQGHSLFKLFIILSLISTVLLGLLGFWVYSLGTSSGIFASQQQWDLAQVSKAIKIFGLPFIVLVIWIIVMSIFYVYLDHFVVTIMAMDHCSFMPAWRKFCDIARQNTKDFFLFLLMLIALGLGAIIATGLISLIIMLAIMLLGLLLGGLLYLLVVLLLKAKLLFMVLSVIFGIPFVAVAIILLASVRLPFAVFFRNFSLYFLSNLDCGYKPLPLE
ncbi:MAG: hypothetical protein FJZ11_00575 [Candidatus Omnitrophica bacterium]|nr:hypothetical protein [Candidatus Omnitrophota bacterium]